MQLDGIDIKQKRARPSRSPAADLQMPPKRFQRRDNAATLAKNRTVAPAAIDRGLFPNIAGTAQAWRDGNRQKMMRCGSRFQAVPNNETPSDLCCNNGVLPRSRT
jgi:hypothetical protein